MTRQFNIRNRCLPSAVLSFLMCMFHLCYASAMECGTVGAMQHLVQSGSEAARGQWPFIVILYNVKRIKYFCGGTVISRKHILTAAHCIQKKNSQDITQPQDLIAYLGSHDLTAKNDQNVVAANISEIHVHHDWDPYSIKHDADLAILVLSRGITFTEYIRPICLPADSVDINSPTIDVGGTIVGWGVSDHSTNLANIPRYAALRALNDSFCYKVDAALRTFSSERTFCGGFGDGIPNHGDSGGGFFVESKHAWVQYGIVSAIRTNATNHVIPDSISVYTNVKLFKNWIVDLVNRVGGRVGEEGTFINLTVFCHYDHTQKLYGCVLEDLDIRKENTLVTSIQTLVAPGKLSQRVDALIFRDGSMVSIPNGFGYYYEDLKILEVNFDVSMNLVTRPSFQKMRQLEDIRLFSPDIKWLDEDSFWDLPNLGRFIMVGTKVVVLEENLFQKNEKLEVILLNSNKLEVLPRRLLEKNSLLKSISIRGNLLKTIDEHTFNFNEKLSEIDLSSNHLEFLNRHFLKNNVQIRLANFSNNFLKTVDDLTFEKNEKLIQLLMSSNQLEALPKDLLKNSFLLEVVDFSKNFLQTIDDNIFGTNTELKMVLFSNNNLELLTRNLFQNNSQLDIVDFNENSIRTIDEETFQANTRLREVRLRSNQIEFLPRNLLKTNLILVNFWLGENLIKSIPEHFLDSNVELKIFEIQMNKIDTLPANLLKNNLQLENFVLDDNSLKALNEDFFATNVKLTEIYLSVNQLETIPKRLFRQNILLQRVGLRDNFFTSIDGKVFETNTKLSDVDLSSNKLEYLPDNLFDNNVLLENINLDNNRLKFIEFDFTKLENVESLTLQTNICVDASLHNFTNIAEFQSFLNTNCSSTISIN